MTHLISIDDACLYCKQASQSKAPGSDDHWVRVYRPAFSRFPSLVCHRRIETEGLREGETLTPPEV